MKLRIKGRVYREVIKMVRRLVLKDVVDFLVFLFLFYRVDM